MQNTLREKDGKGKTGLGNENSRKNNSRNVSSKPNHSLICSQKVLSPWSSCCCASCERHRWRTAALHFPLLLGYAPANQQSFSFLCFSFSGQGEHIGPKNFTQAEAEPEERLTILSLLPSKPDLTLYPKRAQWKAIAKLILSSTNPTEANRSSKTFF